MKETAVLYAWNNGVFEDEKSSTISIFDSSYLYGVGLFETLRASNGKPRFWNDHFERLNKNARTIGLIIPKTSAELRNILEALLAKNHLKDATLRMMLSEDPQGRPSLVITGRPYEPYPERCYLSGAKLVFSKLMKADSETLSALKTTSYLSKMLPRREAKKKGADEALLVNHLGMVTEGASSSLFVVKNKKIVTPPLSNGLLPGTRRKIVIKLAKNLKIPVVEKNLHPKELYSADEAFITSSLKDVMPVGYIEKKKIGKEAPGPITQIIQKNYAKLF